MGGSPVGRKDRNAAKPLARSGGSKKLSNRKNRKVQAKSGIEEGPNGRKAREKGDSSHRQQENSRRRQRRVKAGMGPIAEKT